MSSPSIRYLGYARVSTQGQDLAYQLKKLQAAGCVTIFHEKRSGKSRDGRPELAKLLKLLQPGDVVLATVTDRIARDPLDMLNILSTVKGAGAGLRLLDEPSTPVPSYRT
ncbi:recombinase family protein [Rhizobium sp. PP-CC-3G-465]|uniref:recombinase family protein n=1 Tax=Rhizobium sp. PP-CC-3G-465 TaxID=2135648 RepID=UPI0010E7F626|nr:resolvase-like protein [Rhizobium sp. PP-CC-3G-465]